MLSKGYGYKQILIQTFEYYDMFSSIHGTISRDEMFKFIDELLEVVEMFKTNSNKISTDYLILYTEENRQDAINLASELKREGYVVECDTSRDIATHIKSAEIRNIKEILKITDSDVSVIDVGDNRMTKMKTNQFLNSLNDREVVVPIH